MFPFIRRQRQTVRRRLAHSRVAFVECFPGLASEAGAVWEVMLPFLFAEGLSPAPEDSLYGRYTLVAEGLDDGGREAIGVLGYGLPDPKRRADWPWAETVRDFVGFLGRCRGEPATGALAP